MLAAPKRFNPHNNDTCRKCRINRPRHHPIHLPTEKNTWYTAPPIVRPELWYPILNSYLLGDFVSIQTNALTAWPVPEFAVTELYKKTISYAIRPTQAVLNAVIAYPLATIKLLNTVSSTALRHFPKNYGLASPLPFSLAFWPSPESNEKDLRTIAWEE